MDAAYAFVCGSPRRTQQVPLDVTGQVEAKEIVDPIDDGCRHCWIALADSAGLFAFVDVVVTTVYVVVIAVVGLLLLLLAASVVRIDGFFVVCVVYEKIRRLQVDSYVDSVDGGEEKQQGIQGEGER